MFFSELEALWAWSFKVPAVVKVELLGVFFAAAKSQKVSNACLHQASLCVKLALNRLVGIDNSYT